jgi:hypothetical protein
MSGGLYGRDKAPERACMPLHRWPQIDQRMWLAADAPADLLSEELGARSTYAPISNRKTEKGYGRFLTYTEREDPECLIDPPSARISLARVKAYVDHLIALNNSTATILSRLHELFDAAKVMGPDRDWSFINNIASKIRARHRPARDKRNLKLTEELLDLGFGLMEKANATRGLPPRMPALQMFAVLYAAGGPGGIRTHGGGLPAMEWLTGGNVRNGMICPST